MTSSHSFLAGGGEMGERMRALAWSKTALGPVERWPQGLKTAVRIMLTSQQPFWLGWGPELTYLYNDPYKAIIGGRHPHALGKPFREVWPEIWHLIGPMADKVMQRDEGTYVEAMLLIMERNGYPEETYYTFSYSPVPGDDERTAGLICANTDDTRRVIGERQLATLKELAARTSGVKVWRDACALSVEALATNGRDIPFAFVCAGEATAPELVSASSGAQLLSESGRFRIEDAMRSGELHVVTLDASVGDVPAGAWPRPPSQAAVLPIALGGAGRGGALVVGLNPFRQFDDNYRSFLKLAAAQVGSAITNAQAYEEEMKRAEALAEIDRAKTAFFSNVSHEFRTPLTLMLGPLEETLANEHGALPREAAASLGLAHRNSLRLLKLVNTLLDFSRIEANRIEASYEPVDLPALTADLASLFRSAVEKAGLRLVVDCPPLPRPAHVDRDMWEKIVLNLISNAFKFTFEGAITVAMRQNGSHVELAVSDTGVGIPEADLPRLFQRFHRVSGTRSRTYEGTGIGLALVQELVKLHSGEVSVRSREGEGTTFTVTIPTGTSHLPADRIHAARTPARTEVKGAAFVEEALAWLPGGRGSDVSSDARAEHEALAQAPSPMRDGAARARVLLAEDNADMRDYISRLLSRDFEMDVAADGQAALERIHATPPDIVLTDVMMPRLDGFGLLRALRTDPHTREIPVIMLSARAGEDSRIGGVQAGADDYVVKPFSARELLARVQAHLAMARLRRGTTDAFHEQREALQAALGHEPLATSLGALTRSAVRQLGPGTRAAFYLADEQGTSLHHVVGMPEAYAQAVDGFPIGPESLSCGLATHTGQPVLTADVTKEPAWAQWLWMAEKFDFRGCWSFPIHTAERRFAGTLAIYSRDPRDPAAHDLAVAGSLVDAAAIIIARHSEMENRKRTAEAVGKLAAIVESSDDAIVSKNLDGIITSWNRGAEHLFGYAAQEVIGRPVTILIPPERLDEEPGILQRIRDGLRIEHYETVRHRKDGTLVDVSLSVSPILDAGGKIVGASKIARDISERKRAERQAEEDARTQEGLYRVSRLLAGELDVDRMVQAVTDTATELSGAQFGAFFYNVNNAAGESYMLFALSGAPREAFEKFGMPRNTAVFEPTFAGREVVRLDDVTKDPRYGRSGPHHGMPKGHLPVRSYLAAPVKSRTGEVIGALLFGHPQPGVFMERAERLVTGIAGQVAVAIDNARLVAQLRETDRHKDDFLAMLSHELRNPLAPMRHCVTLLQQADEGEIRRYASEILDRQVEHMTRLVEDLLDISRISRGDVSLRKHEVDLADVVRIAVETSRPLLEAAGHRLDINLPRSPVNVVADRLRLAQVFSNLLNNAAKYTPAGGRIGLELSKANGTVAVSVRDNGIGIAAGDMPRLFSMYTQLESGRRRAPGGLGVGLALARQLVELHGGTIEARSPGAGQGSEFTVRIPLPAADQRSGPR
jgi:PAS domain S-box-containing protein